MFLKIIQNVFGYLIGALTEHLSIQKLSPRNGRGKLSSLLSCTFNVTFNVQILN